eukprot:3421553-Amphidinium_carterae.1
MLSSPHAVPCKRYLTDVPELLTFANTSQCMLLLLNCLPSCYVRVSVVTCLWSSVKGGLVEGGRVLFSAVLWPSKGAIANLGIWQSACVRVHWPRPSDCPI